MNYQVCIKHDELTLKFWRVNGIIRPTDPDFEVSLCLEQANRLADEIATWVKLKRREQRDSDDKL